MYHGLGLFNFVRNFSVRFSMRELGRETTDIRGNLLQYLYQ